jgi:PAS domain S-box-containing protein/putative nucleotidyltransferase with HDIG domain
MSPNELARIKFLRTEIKQLKTELVKAGKIVSKQDETRRAMLYMLEDLDDSRHVIERAKREWETTFDAVTDPIFLHDTDDNIIRVNRAYAEHAGMSMQEIIGKPYWQIFPILDGPIPSCIHAREVKKDAGEEEEEEEVRLESGEIYLSHSYAVRGENGDHLYSIHFMEDITERKLALNRLQQSLEGTVHAIAAAVEMRDPYTAGHQRRVAHLAKAIAEQIGLDEERINGLSLGAEIHDIGKIHLPAEILVKPTKLTDTEYELIKEHSQIGYDILKDIDFPWPIADIAHQHHERMDGTGYPQGLKNDKICLEAKIVAVADVVEAMASHRPYRPALGIDVALKEISEKKGKFYWPDAVDACLKVFAEGFAFEKDNRNKSLPS